MKKVTVGVVLHGTKYLKESLPSLIDQDYEKVEFIFRDQEEGKWSAHDFIKKELPKIFEKIKIEKGKNLWHSGGHNAIINEMSGQYYFCCSNDMVYPKDFVSKMVKKMEDNPEYSFATPKIKRWDYKKSQKTNYIDSFGIGITEYHHFYDIGQGEEDNGQYKKMNEVFGVSGACCVFTKEALESVRFKDEYFDSLMHYKNDVDLSYRLRWAGQKAMLVHEVTVYHDRQLSGLSKKSFFERQSSFFGEKILMKKNYSKKFPWKVRIKTRLYYFLKTTFLLLKHPTLIRQDAKLKLKKTEILAKKNAIPKVSIKNIVAHFK